MVGRRVFNSVTGDRNPHRVPILWLIGVTVAQRIPNPLGQGSNPWWVAKFVYVISSGRMTDAPITWSRRTH